MSVHAVDKLMVQTYELTAEFRQTTRQPLPVIAKIVNIDAVRRRNFETIQPPLSGYEAGREVIKEAMGEKSESMRSKRGAISIARFRHIASLVCCREEVEVSDQEIWENNPGS